MFGVMNVLSSMGPSASGASEMRLLDTFLGLENSDTRDKRGDGSDDETDGEDEE